MLRGALFLAGKDIRYMLRTRETIFWTFLMPIVFFFFIGNITGGASRRSPDAKDPLVVEASPSAGFLATHLDRRLERAGYQILTPEGAGTGSRAPRLSIPPAFTDSVLAGHPVTVTVTRGSAGLGADFDEVRIRRAVLTVLADVVATSGGGARPNPEALAIVAEAPPALRLDVTPAGARREIPTGFEQAIPGTMVMFTLLVLLTSGSVLMVVERREGLLRRLASSPMSRTSVILGKWGGRFALGLIQIGFAMLAGTLIFHMRWGPHLGALIAVLLVYAGLIGFLGIVLGSLARTEGQAVGIGVLASNLLAALGGCWWPIEITPGWMQKLALLLPTGWAMDALHKLVSFGAPPASVLPHLAVTALAALVAAWGAVRLFRFQ